MTNRLTPVLSGAIFLFVGLFFAVFGGSILAQERADRHRLATAGESIQATVLRKWIQSERTSSTARTSYRVSYGFTPPGSHEVSGSAEVDLDTWQSLKPGSAITAHYVPTAPGTHRIDGQTHDFLLPLVFLAIGLVFAGIGGAILVAGLRKRSDAGEDARRRRGLIGAVTHIVSRYPLHLFGALWLMIAAPFVVAGVYGLIAQQAEDAQFAAEAERASGIVLEKAVVTESGNGGGSSTYRTRHYRVTFRYATNAGEEVVGVTDVDSDTWDRLVERGPIAVTYLPHRPELYRVEGGTSGWTAAVLFLLFALVGCAVGGGALVLARRGGRGQDEPDASIPQSTSHSPAATPPVAQLDPALAARTAAAVLGAAARAQSDGRVWIRIGSGGWVLPLVGGVFFLAGSGMALTSVLDLFEEQSYARRGVVTEGQIVGKSIEEATRSDRGSTKYIASYRFTTGNGETAEGRRVLPVEAWEGIKDGDRVSVRYLPDDPQTNREVSEDGTRDAFILIIAGVLLAGLGGVIVLALAHGMRRRGRLMREGAASKGVVVTVEDSDLTINNVTQQQLVYRFRDSAGREHQGTSEPLSPGEAFAWSAGDVGEVRYDPNRPDENIWIGRPGSAPL